MVLFSRKAIKTLHATTPYYALCEKFPIPQGSGNQMSFNGWNLLAAASSELAESSSNSAVNLSSRLVNVTIVSYGRHVKITDLAELTSIIGPVEGATKELTQSARLTLDNVVQRAVYKNRLAQVGTNSGTKTLLLSAWLAGQASSFNANDGATGTQTGGSAIARDRLFGFPAVFGTSATRLSAGTTASISSLPGPILIRKAVGRLKRLNVAPKSNGAYVGVTHPNFVSGLFSNSDYKQYVVNYAQGPQESFFLSSPTHRIHGVEIIESSNSPRYSTSAISSSPIFICGEGALGCVELGGSGFEIIIKRPGPSTVSQPYNLAMSVAFKLRSVAAVLNPSAGVIAWPSAEKL